ncbi:MAG: hypothetical protein P1V51_20455 [Deltaproteobacteria bacterium]|nr:hypothetical protein [Deltaproteobacteria bacterium]
MELLGDPTGIAALKALAQADKSYLKFLINEARSNTDLCTRFTDPQGVHWVLRIDPATGNLLVEPVG